MNRILLRLGVALAVLMAVIPAFAADGSVTLSAFPTIAEANGRQPITITAEVRDRSGNLVPDGTQVVFEAQLGTFRESIVRTENGYARATLVAGSLAGICKVRVSVLRFNANSTLDIELVSDRSLLSSAKEYVEVTAPDYLQYSMQDRIIEATGQGQQVFLRYREITIEADDLQLRVPTYEVRARNAKVKMGDTIYNFNQLYMRLNRRTGSGVTEIDVDVIKSSQAGFLIGIERETRPRVTVVDISRSGVKPHEGQFDYRVLNFQALGDSLSTVEAKKAVAFPTREIQFHRAAVKVTGVTIQRVPLFAVSVYNSSPLITEQMLNVSNNQIAVNYPYYLSLKPGETSLLRLRHGTRFGAGVGATGGTYLDYELKWNKGDEAEGGLTLSGIARDDWSIGARQYWQINPETTLTAQLDFPAHRSMVGNVNMSRLFDGFQLNANASHSSSLTGPDFQSQNYLLIAEKDPIKLGDTGSLYLGVTANASQIRSNSFSRYQQGVGLQARVVGRTIRLNKNASLSASYRVNHLSGHNVNSGLSHFGTVNLSMNMGSGVIWNNTYEYVNDGFNSELLGQHRITSEAYYNQGRWSLSGFVAKTLDLDRLNANATLNYQFSPLWRFYYSYYIDQFDGDSFMDQTYILGYRIGYREVGISYSLRTNRLGIEILGTRF